MIKSLTKNDVIDLFTTLKPYLTKKNLILSVNFIRLGIPTFSIPFFLDNFLKIIQPNLIAIQSYSEFTDRTNRTFSRYHSPVTNSLSSLSKQSFKLYPKHRLLSPTHSFILIGSSGDTLNHFFTSAFGVDSTFSYFLDKNFYWLNLGSYLSETCTFIHHIESSYLNLIDYRNEIIFPVKIFPEKKLNTFSRINYTYLERNKAHLDIDYNWLPIQRHQSLSHAQLGINYHPVSIYKLQELMNIGESLLSSNPFIFTKKIS